jgi:hypothetical protein
MTVKRHQLQKLVTTFHGASDLREDTRQVIDKQYQAKENTLNSPKANQNHRGGILESGMDRIPSIVKVSNLGINKKIMFKHFRAGGLKSHTQNALQKAIQNSTLGFFLQNPEIFDELQEDQLEDSMMLQFEYMLNNPMAELEDIEERDDMEHP